MEAKQISKAVIKRLPRYYRYLGELLEDNVVKYVQFSLIFLYKGHFCFYNHTVYLLRRNNYDFIMSGYLQILR